MNDVIPQETNQIIAQNEDALSRVVQKGLRQIEDILDADPKDFDPEERIKLMSIKKDAASAIINAGLKADENRFRRENKDIIEKLFDKIKKDGKMIEGHITRRS